MSPNPEDAARLDLRIGVDRADISYEGPTSALSVDHLRDLLALLPVTTRVRVTLQHVGPSLVAGLDPRWLSVLVQSQRRLAEGGGSLTVATDDPQLADMLSRARLTAPPLPMIPEQVMS